MAISVEDANKVWQKAQITLDSLGFSGDVRDQVRALKAYLSQAKNNPQLEFIPIADLTADVVEADAACKLYAIVVKKQATATDAFLVAFNDATDDSTAGDAMQCIGLITSGEEGAYFNGNGFDLAAGLVIGSYTALIGSNGTTATTSGDGPDGFAIIGNP